MTTEKELALALKNNAPIIEVEGDLAPKVAKIKGIDPRAWELCIAGITMAVTASAVTIGTAGIAAPVAGPAVALSLGAAATILGLSSAITATGIAVAGGGVDVLNNLRFYRAENVSETKIVLYRD